MTTEGAQSLRPWMLSWRADHGCSGYIEPETGGLIMELMLVEGFLAVNFAATISFRQCPFSFEMLASYRGY